MKILKVTFQKGVMFSHYFCDEILVCNSEVKETHQIFIDIQTFFNRILVKRLKKFYQIRKYSENKQVQVSDETPLHYGKMS